MAPQAKLGRLVCLVRPSNPSRVQVGKSWLGTRVVRAYKCKVQVQSAKYVVPVVRIGIGVGGAVRYGTYVGGNVWVERVLME